jgi:hypothetical protein
MLNMLRYPIDVRIAINGSLPQKPARRPQSRLAMQGQPWTAPAENATLLAARTNITPCQITQHPLNHARM